MRRSAPADVVETPLTGGLARSIAWGGRLRRFNPWRRAASDPLRRFVAEVVASVIADSIRDGRWKRRPRGDDLPTLRGQIEAIVADLVQLHRVREDGADELVVSRDAGFLGYSRYRHGAVETRGLPRVLDALEASGFVRQTRGLPRYVARHDEADADEAAEYPEGLPAKPSTLRAAPALLAAFQDLQLGVDDVRADDARETITLAGRRMPGGYRELIEYRDTAHTRALRAEMQAINAWLASFTVTVAGDSVYAAGRGPLWRTFIYEGRAKAPPGTPEVFGLGGRLYGGFWQTQPSARRGHLRIDGEPVAFLEVGRRQAPRSIRHDGATLVAALLECKARGVHALPMHHAILVRESQIERAGAILGRAFGEEAGGEALVSRQRHDLERA